MPGVPKKLQESMGPTTPSLRFSASVSRAAVRISRADREPVSLPTMRPTCLRPASSEMESAEKTPFTSVTKVLPESM